MRKELAGMDVALSVLFRWLHVIFAALAIGGVFFMRVILPAGIRHLDDATRNEVFARCRHVFKRVIHTAILILLISGFYNFFRLMPQYDAEKPLLHVLFGLHFALGLAVFGISIWLLLGKTPPAAHRMGGMINLVLLLLLVLIGSGLKTLRERYNPPMQTAPAVPTNAP